MKPIKTTILVIIFSSLTIAQEFWEEIVPPTVNPYSLDVSNNNNVYIVFADSLIRSTDNGQSWEGVCLAYAGWSTFTTSPTGVIYLFTDSLRKSTDEGNTWIRLDSPVRPYIFNPGLIRTNGDGDIFIQIDNSAYNYSDTYRSTDEGSSWIAVGIDSSTMFDIIFRDTLCFAIFYKSGYDHLYKSSNNGNTWEIISNAPTNLNTLFASNTGKLFAGRYARYGNPAGNLFISEDNGNSWETLSIFNNISVRDIHQDQFGNIFVATVSGVFRSVDNGILWQQINSGLNYVWCQKLASDSSGYVYVTAGIPQILYRSIQSTSPAEVDFLVINNFSLKQNYPNPFNPSTTIQYELAEKSFVTLTVYDVIGNEIETLVNEEKSAGSYEVKFKAISLPSGVYFYQLKAGSFVETKKMILMR